MFFSKLFLPSLWEFEVVDDLLLCEIILFIGKQYGNLTKVDSDLYFGESLRESARIFPIFWLPSFLKYSAVRV